MAHREFKDEQGVLWQAWEVRPSGGILPTDVREGWLAFLSQHERRRLAPIPPMWEALDDAELQVLLARATRGALPRRLIE